MKKNILDKKFSHHSWFKEGVTRQYALDFFAKSPYMVLGQKRSRKQSMELFSDTVYEDIITDGHSSYKLCEEEKEYYIERKKYYDEQKRIEEEKWLDSEVDFEKEIFIYVGTREINIKNIKYKIKKANEDNIDYWTKELEKTIKRWDILDNIIKENRDEVKTNKDFIWLKGEIDKVDYV